MGNAKYSKYLRMIGFLIYANLISLVSSGQRDQRLIHSTAGEQLAAALKIQVEFSTTKNFILNWRVGLSGGAGSFLIRDILYPSIQTDMMLYHGGIGSKWPGIRTRSYFDLELDIGYTLTAGFNNRMKYASKINPVIRNYPLYYFKNLTSPTLQNPFNFSGSWGGNAIIFFTRKKEKFQQVGFVNLHLDRLQLSYSNDGPPFSQPFGDKYDRLHTGGGFISLHGNYNWDIDLIEFGFNKFTGYSRNTYEMANKVGTSYMYYNDEKQQQYNKSQIYLNVGSSSHNWGGSLIFSNFPQLDVQHMIHENMFYPLHMVPYNSSISVGLSHQNYFSKIGLQ